MLVGSAIRRVAIIGGVRIPFARAYGAYATAGNQDMLTAAFRAVVERYRLQGERLGDVAAGAVIKHPRDYNLVRESVLSTGLDPQTPGLDMQRACGTSLEAAILVGNKIALGQIEAGIAGGVDSISDPPIVYPRSYQQLLLRSYRGRTAWQRLAPWFGLRPRHFKPVLPAWSSRAPGCPWARAPSSWPRAGRSPAPSRMSWPMRATARRRRPGSEGFYEDLVIEYLGLEADNNMRADTSAREARQAAADLRRRGHAHRRQQHAADRRRQRRAAGTPGVGGASATCRCSRICATARCGRSISPAARKAC